MTPDGGPATEPRPLTDADLDWVVALAGARRERLAAAAPRLWRPASDATARHRAFVAHLLADPGALTLRTDHGYVVAVGDATRRVVDDLAVDEALGDEAWGADGVALLRAVVERTGTTRVLAPEVEPARRAAAEAVGLVAVEAWWHRDLPLVQVRGDGGRVQLSTDGATGRLVPAPPVHDPGGDVLLVSDVDSAAALAVLESEAAERGATVSVVTQRADDLMRELLVVEAGHVRTATFLQTPGR